MKLKQQQQELELMSAKYLQNEEQTSISRKLNEIRDEVNR